MPDVIRNICIKTDKKNCYQCYFSHLFFLIDIVTQTIHWEQQKYSNRTVNIRIMCFKNSNRSLNQGALQHIKNGKIIDPCFRKTEFAGCCITQGAEFRENHYCSDSACNQRKDCKADNPIHIIMFFLCGIYKQHNQKIQDCKNTNHNCNIII